MSHFLTPRLFTVTSFNVRHNLFCPKLEDAWIDDGILCLLPVANLGKDSYSLDTDLSGQRPLPSPMSSPMLAFRIDLVGSRLQ